ncbi:hypothetical protein K8W59_03355 [Nocardioides rotundus]|uniref:hypothetical protein n=1 Tax=Nocardioides rotundus TaxID=1774216 RepID=UPI001CBD6B83|nr:hypothetical protein [Nocardioides rotundus]UAL30574.1 hypothetical protein K8W59_03355 [Nocardioides rotundus]
MTAVVMPAMQATQEASWLGLFRLAKSIPDGWTLVGGQMVHLHCAERGVDPYRSTPDIDTVLDVRGIPQILVHVTTVLEEVGFQARGVTMGEKQHRWVQRDGPGVIDVLIPENLGRAADHQGAGGFPGLPTPGAQLALNRSEPVVVRVGSVTGTIRRPTLLGATIAKAAAYSITGVTNRSKHLDDIALLSSMLSARDLRDAELTKGERRYLRAALPSAHAHPVTAEILGASEGIRRLQRLVD